MKPALLVMLALGMVLYVCVRIWILGKWDSDR